MKKPKVELFEELIDLIIEDHGLEDSDHKERLLKKNAMECFSDPFFDGDQCFVDVNVDEKCALWDYCVAAYGVRYGVGVRENEEVLDSIKRNLDRGWESVHQEVLGSIKKDREEVVSLEDIVKECESGCGGCTGSCSSCPSKEVKQEDNQEDVQMRFTVAEAAEFLGCSVASVYSKIKKGIIVKGKGRKGKISRDQLESLK